MTRGRRRSPTAAFIVPGLIMLSLFTREHLQRQLRHLHAQIHGHDLRAALGTRLAAGDGDRLCRRGGDQADVHRPASSSRRRISSSPLPIAHPLCDDRLPGADRRRASACSASSSGMWAQGFEQLQHHPDADRDAAHLPRRRLLLGRICLPEPWRTITHFNPVVYLISGFQQYVN